MSTLIDSYANANVDSNCIGDVNIKQAVQFLVSSTGYKLEKILVKMKYVVNAPPAGNLTLKIYASAGTPGTNAVPTGSALATSDPIDQTTITTSYVMQTFNFSGANRISLTNGAYYFFVLETTGMSQYMCMIGSYPAFRSGFNVAYWITSWNVRTTDYTQFELYGIPASVVSPPNFLQMF